MRKSRNDPQLADALALAGDLRLVLGRLKRRLREQAQLGELSWTQMRVLAGLDRDEPATVSSLARAEGMRPQSMGELVAALKSAGLVSGEPDPADGRQTVLSLTVAGRDRVKRARAERDDWLAHAIQRHLGADEQRRLAQALELLQRLVDA
jgi:DNA-binding MarR family transcriptional regulator